MKRRTFLQTTMAAAALTPFASGPLLAGGYRPPPVTPADLDAIRGDGRQVTIRGGAVKDLAASLHGQLLLADSAGYQTARLVLNPGIDKHPALIVQPTGVTDVRRAVAFAQAHGLLVAVKCGGHSFSGMSTCDKGMMIDLSAMRGAHVDPAARRVWVQGGTLLGLVAWWTFPSAVTTSTAVTLSSANPNLRASRPKPPPVVSPPTPVCDTVPIVVTRPCGAVS